MRAALKGRLPSTKGFGHFLHMMYILKALEALELVWIRVEKAGSFFLVDSFWKIWFRSLKLKMQSEAEAGLYIFPVQSLLSLGGYVFVLF